MTVPYFDVSAAARAAEPDIDYFAAGADVAPPRPAAEVMADWCTAFSEAAAAVGRAEKARRDAALSAAATAANIIARNRGAMNALHGTPGNRAARRAAAKEARRAR